jgi:drug/metabolite transporter (DMT)-like permease
MHHARLGILFMLIATVFFASMGACLKYALVAIPLYQAVFFRASISSLILGLVILGKRLPYLGKNRKVLLMRSLAGFVAMSCGFAALAHIPFADATVLHQTSPLFVALFGILFLRERVALSLVLLIGVALVGVTLVLAPEWQMANLYGLLAVAGGAFAGLAYVFVRRLHQTDSFWIIAFHFASVTSLLSLPLMIWGFVLPTPGQWAALIGAGLLGTGGQIFMTLSYRYDEAARLAPFTYLSVLIAFIYGMMFWGEVPNLQRFIGMIFVAGAGMAIARLNLSAKRTVSPSPTD